MEKNKIEFAKNAALKILEAGNNLVNYQSKYQKFYDELTEEEKKDLDKLVRTDEEFMQIQNKLVELSGKINKIL